MYIQRNHMLCRKLRICHDLYLYQNLNYNAYSTPLRHEDLDMYHKMVIMGIDLCYNTFSHLCVKHQHYHEHDTLCLFILYYWIFFFILPDQ